MIEPNPPYFVTYLSIAAAPLLSMTVTAVVYIAYYNDSLANTTKEQ